MLSNTFSPVLAIAGMPTSLWNYRPRRYFLPQASFTRCA
jgi:hypothetical protein